MRRVISIGLFLESLSTLVQKTFGGGWLWGTPQTRVSDSPTRTQRTTTSPAPVSNVSSTTHSPLCQSVIIFGVEIVVVIIVYIIDQIIASVVNMLKHWRYKNLRRFVYNHH